jgi:hypothetical protein
LAGAGFEKYTKVTRRGQFLAEMDRVVPWRELCARIEPVYPTPGNGRPPVGLERMLRLYFLQHWFNLSDPAVEEAVYDSPTMRAFVGIDLGREPVPDETTVCKFRHLLEEHGLGHALFDRRAAHLDGVDALALDTSERAIEVTGRTDFHDVQDEPERLGGVLDDVSIRELSRQCRVNDRCHPRRPRYDVLKKRQSLSPHRWVRVRRETCHVEKIHTGQVLEGRYESKLTASPMQRLLAEWLAERARFIGSLIGLTDEQFNSETAPNQWTYRVVAKHVLTLEQDSLETIASDQAARPAASH